MRSMEHEEAMVIALPRELEVTTYQQAHVIEKCVSHGCEYQSIKKHIPLGPAVPCRAWGTGRTRSPPARAMRPPGTYNPVASLALRLVDDQICIVRGKDLVNSLECHAERIDGPIHAKMLSS